MEVGFVLNAKITTLVEESNAIGVIRSKLNKILMENLNICLRDATIRMILLTPVRLQVKKVQIHFTVFVQLI